MIPKCKRCLLALSLLMMMTVAVSMVSDSSSEALESTATTEWYTYGHNLELVDRNYNVFTYSSISWTYSDEPLSEANPGTTVPGDSTRGYSYQLSLNPADYPFWGVKPLFVRETAQMTDGTTKMTEFRINVNPIPDVSHILFMYDDTHGYRYQHISRTTSVGVGSDVFVELPLDPSRDGYRFDGWLNEDGTVFDNKRPITFTSETDVKVVYPKWTSVPGPSPTVRTNYVTVQTVNGLMFEYDNMVVQRGTSFSFTVSVMDGFKFDLKELGAMTDRGDRLNRSENPDGSYKFTLNNVDRDTSVILIGYKQYFRVITVFDDVSTIGHDDWVIEGSTLSLPLKTSGGKDIHATVYMGATDVTGNTYSDRTVNILSVDGDVMIFAHSVESTPSDMTMFWMFLAIGALMIIGAIIYILHRRRRNEEE